MLYPFLSLQLSFHRIGHFFSASEFPLFHLMLCFSVSTLTEPRWFWRSLLPPSARWQAQCARDRPSVPHVCMGTVPGPHTTVRDDTWPDHQGTGAWYLGVHKHDDWSWLTAQPPLSSQALPREPPHSIQATSKDKANSTEATERRRRGLPPSSSGLTAMSRQAFWMFLKVLSAKCRVRHGKDLSHGPEE